MNPQTKLEIVNRALGVLGATYMTSIDENSSESYIIEAHYNQVLKHLLSDYPFNFSVKVKKIDVSTSDEGVNCYILPSDCLKLWTVNHTDNFEVLVEDFNSSETIVAVLLDDCGKITQEGQVSEFKYVFLNEDVTMWTGTFTTYFVHALACELCLSIRESNSSLEVLTSLKRKYEYEAKRADSKESGNSRYNIKPSFSSFRYNRGRY